MLVFSGGLPEDITGAQPAITLMHGKNTTVLEMEFCVIDFATLTDSPYRSDQTDPQSILVLLTNDLVAIDCKSTGLPSFENPYAMDLQVRLYPPADPTAHLLHLSGECGHLLLLPVRLPPGPAGQPGEPRQAEQAARRLEPARLAGQRGSGVDQTRAQAPRAAR